MNELVIPILIGFGVALVVTLGLYFGMQLLIDLSTNPDQPKKGLWKRRFLAGFYLIGQFLVAIFVFAKVPSAKDHPAAVGFSMVISVFVIMAVLKRKDPPPAA